MRILANYGARSNGDSYSVTFETMGDVPADKAPGTVDELFRLAREAVKRQIGGSHAAATQAVEDPIPVPRPVGHAHANGNGSGRKPVIKDPSQPASPKQLQLIRQLARQKGAWLEGLEDLTKGEASQKVDTNDRIRDYKVTKRAPTPAQVAQDIQLTAYSPAHRLTHPTAERGLQLDVMVRTKQPKVLHLPATRTPTDHARFLKLLGHVAKGIQSELFYPNPNFTCPSCPFRKRCDVWQEI